MKYIVENWFVIVGLIAVLTAGGYAVYVFVKMPSDKQLNKISIPAALMWWGTPLIVGGLILYDTIQEKNPELCGFTAEEFDKEENK